MHARATSGETLGDPACAPRRGLLEAALPDRENSCGAVWGRRYRVGQTRLNGKIGFPAALAAAGLPCAWSGEAQPDPVGPGCPTLYILYLGLQPAVLTDITSSCHYLGLRSGAAEPPHPPPSTPEPPCPLIPFGCCGQFSVRYPAAQIAISGGCRPPFFFCLRCCRFWVSHAVRATAFRAPWCVLWPRWNPPPAVVSRAALLRFGLRFRLPGSAGICTGRRPALARGTATAHVPRGCDALRLPGSPRSRGSGAGVGAVAGAPPAAREWPGGFGAGTEGRRRAGGRRVRARGLWCWIIYLVPGLQHARVRSPPDGGGGGGGGGPAGGRARPQLFLGCRHPVGKILYIL